MQFPPQTIPILVTYQILIGNNGAILFYNGNPGPGNLVISLAPEAGVDRFGNAYPEGLHITNGTSTINISNAGGIITEQFITGNPSIEESGFLQAASVGTGAFEIDQLALVPGQNATQGDFGSLYLSGDNNGGTNPGRASLQYECQAGQFSFVNVSCGGATISAGSIAAVHPGSGTSPANVAVAETWQTPTLNAGWTVTGANTPVRYKLYADNTVAIAGEVLTSGAGPWPAGGNIFALPTGYVPTVMSAFITESAIAAAAGTPTVSVLNSSGNVKNGQAFTAAGQLLRFDGVRFPLD